MQVGQTYNPEIPVQIITAAIPQTTSESGSNAVEPMGEKMEKNNAKPKELLGDSAYGSDENVLNTASKNINLPSPANGVCVYEHVVSTLDFWRCRPFHRHSNTPKIHSFLLCFLYVSLILFIFSSIFPPNITTYYC